MNKLTATKHKQTWKEVVIYVKHHLSREKHEHRSKKEDKGHRYIRLNKSEYGSDQGQGTSVEIENLITDGYRVQHLETLRSETI